MKIFNNVLNIKELLSYFTQKEYKKNEIIFYEKADCDMFYYLMEGKVTLLSYSSHGKKKIFFTIDSDDIINDFDSNFFKYPYQAVAFEKSKVLSINQNTLNKLFKSNYQLFRNCLDLQSHRTRRLYRQLKNTTSINIEKKLAAKLWKFSKDFGIKESNGYTLIDIKINNTYLADVIGCSRETISRSMQILIKMELLLIKDNKYYIKQEEMLNYYRQ